MKLVLFDFDGTITKTDTLMSFTKFAVGPLRFFSGLIFISPVLVLQKAGLISAQKAKEIFLSHFFGGMTLAAFDSKCGAFNENELPSLIRDGAAESIANYDRKNHRVIIVSASPENWIKAWASKMNMELLSTRLEIADGKLTGKIQGVNCNGEEKVSRIKALLNLDDYKEVIVYGDTSGDYPMLALATEKHFKPFRENDL